MYNEITNIVTKALKENKDRLEREWYVSLYVDNDCHLGTADMYLDSKIPKYAQKCLLGTDDYFIAEIKITKEQYNYIVENKEELIWQIN